jgi:flagellar FliJ protein
MKRFQFKLQAVLTLRLRAEQEALAHYAQAIQTGRAAREKFAEAETELSDARRCWLNALADGLPAARAAQMRAHSHWLEERKQRCEQTMRLAEVEVERASRRMVLARQQREVVEKHLANQREQYDRALAGEERREAESRQRVNERVSELVSENRTSASASSPYPLIRSSTYPLTHSPTHPLTR